MKSILQIGTKAGSVMISKLRLCLVTAITLAHISINAQDGETIGNDLKEAFKAVANYSSQGGNRTPTILRQIGFIPPDNIKKTFESFPAVRQIETAYLHAKARGDGEKMIALLYQNLSQRYESIKTETALARFQIFDLKPNTIINFGTISLSQLPTSNNLDPIVKEAILSISKYSDARALGGSRGILKFYLNLSDDLTYEILRSSSTNLDALLSGLEKSSIPPTHKERLKIIIEDLAKSYESARSNPKLKKFHEAFTLEKMPHGRQIQAKLASRNIVAEYNNYMKEGASKFDYMIKENHRWGGVVFGNKVISDPLTVKNKLKYVLWIHDPFSNAGTLEFVFDGEDESKVMTEVLYEDVYAAFKILYDTKSKVQTWKKGEGIGLIGSIRMPELPDYRSVVIHPAVASLELGRALFRADVLPRIQHSIKNKILTKTRVSTHQLDILEDWMRYGNDTFAYKFTDAPLIVGIKNGFMVVSRDDTKTTLNDNYVNFSYSSASNSSYKEYTKFSTIVPILSKTYYDYYRLNNFARTLGILRWAKEQNAEFLNVPKSPKPIKTPELLYINRTKGTVEIIEVNRFK